jgi:P-type E1-E2 ATPase
MMNDKLTNNKTCLILKEPKNFKRCSVSGKDQESGEAAIDNNKVDTDTLKSNFSEMRWADVRCGDLIFLQEGEHLPADMVFLMSSADNGECFVQTSSLDGERALKHK